MGESDHNPAKDLPTLKRILRYRNAAVIDRFQKKLNLTEKKAQQLFKDVLRFLWLQSVTRGSISPPVAIDAGWHEFILFTADYAKFCEKLFGKFIHHRPNRPNDPPEDGKSTVRMRRALDTHLAEIGSLSRNWTPLPLKVSCSTD